MQKPAIARVTPTVMLMVKAFFSPGTEQWVTKGTQEVIARQDSSMKQKLQLFLADLHA